MKKFLIVGLPMVCLLMGCMVGPGPRGSGGVVIVPALPSVVVLEAEPYYQQGSYFYFYQNNSWSYSNSKSGPWVELPRDRYPKEVKLKDQGRDKGKGENRGQDKRGKE